MWGISKDKFADLEWAIEFTGNHELYGSWMIKVADSWNYSCDHNLSNMTQNRRAWIGHAACAFANKCPEDIVRKAWGYLTKEQQDSANYEADKAIKYWENKKCQNDLWG